MSFKILITGDYCLIGRNSIAFDLNDFGVFENFLSYSLEADLSITNLEAPTTENQKKIIKSGPNIKTKKNVLKPLKNAGFSLVTLANNHILDYGEQGVLDTIENCKKNNINYVGAGNGLKEARKPHIQIIKGKKIGILNFAENEYCAATKSTYGANPVNVITNHYDIKEAKNKVDFLIVIAHGGREHYQLPTPKQRERYRFYANSGADLVVGHHTHCYSGFEVYNDTPIFYSLGNFIFDYKKKYQKGLWTQGYGVMFSFNNDKISYELIPYTQGKESTPNIELLTGQEREEFNRKISSLNRVISNDNEFFAEWNKYLKTQERSYKGDLFIQNKYIRYAISKGFLPNAFFHSKFHKRGLLNLFRCESHREIMTSILEKDIK